jgi:hypothetical protein
MHIKIKPHDVPLSEDDIAHFETEFGLALPRDYRDFLLRYNGGDIDRGEGLLPGFYAKPDPPLDEEDSWIAPDDFWDIALFHGLNFSNSAYGDLRDLSSVMRDWGHSAELLPIASSYSNSKYFLCCNGPHRDQVLLAGATWGINRSHGKPVTLRDYHVLCRSFDEMCDGLRLIPTPR